MKKNDDYYGNKKQKFSFSGFIAAVVALAVIAGISFIAAEKFRKNQTADYIARSKYYCNYSLDAEIFKNISDIRYYDSGLAVYTDADGGKGLLSLDGNILTGADYSDFSFVSNGWRNTICIAFVPDEDYPKLVDVENKRVDKKQYQSLEADTGVVFYDAAEGALTKIDSLGDSIKLEPADAALANGLYAVPFGADDTAKYGYIDASLNAVIPGDYSAALDFSDNLGAVSDGEKWGFINPEGECISGYIYDSVGSFTVSGESFCFSYLQGLVPVLADGKMGIVDLDGKTVVDFDFDVILQGENQKYIVKKDSSWYLMSLEAVPEVETVTYANAENGLLVDIGDYKIKTAGSPLRMRESPSADAAVIAKVPNGTWVTVTKSVSGWACISYNGYTGWVSTEYIEKV